MPHSLQSFFTHFPESIICVAGWDIGQTHAPIERKWHEFTLEELTDLNLNKKQSIYFTPCDVGERNHKSENHRGIRAWYCDIDVSGRHEEVTDEEIDKRKSEVLGRIMVTDTEVEGKRTLKPSFIVETRNGFHVYWLAWNERKLDERYSPVGGLYRPSMDNFDWIEKNIGERLGGDDRARKPVQLMRLPGFSNWKQGRKHSCRVLKEFNFEQCGEFREYCDEEWLQIFGDSKKKEELRQRVVEDIEERRRKLNLHRERVSYHPERSFDVFKFAKEYPQQEALMRFSGALEVNGESYSFRSSMGGKHLNIVINGQVCSSFIDLSSNTLMCRAGTGRGSPNIIEWLKWYHPEWERDKKTLANTLTKYLCPRNQKMRK